MEILLDNLITKYPRLPGQAFKRKTYTRLFLIQKYMYYKKASRWIYQHTKWKTAPVLVLRLHFMFMLRVKPRLALCICFQQNDQIYIILLYHFTSTIICLITHLTETICPWSCTFYVSQFGFQRFCRLYMDTFTFYNLTCWLLAKYSRCAFFDFAIILFKLIRQLSQRDARHCRAAEQHWLRDRDSRAVRHRSLVTV